MARLQPAHYEHLPNVDAVVRALDQPANLGSDFAKLRYLKADRDRRTPNEIGRVVRELLVPKLRRVRL